MPLALTNVSCVYQTGTPAEVTALRDISLSIEDGEFVGIIGHTGSGKTSLIQAAAGLLAPTSGNVYLDGKDINAPGYDRQELRKNVGLVFQYPTHQLFETTVEKDVAFGLKYSGLSADEVGERVRWALQVVGLPFDEIRQFSPLALSGGEKRRVAIAGILVSRPRFLILDEPIAGLDPKCRDSFMRMLARMNANGTTVIMVSHNIDVLGEHAKRLIVFDSGKVVMDGTTAQVFADPRRLKELRLQPSTPRIIADMLSERGLPIPPDTVSYNQLLDALLLGLERRGVL
jgi:energy-coupling factor transport system ATP-binding protein